MAGALTPAGLGGCVIELLDRGLVDFVISTGANLYHDLHYALNFTLHRGSPFLDDVELYEDGVIRIYDVLFPLPCCWKPMRTSAISSSAPRSTVRFRAPSCTTGSGGDLLERRAECEEYSVVAKAAATGVPIYTSSPGDSSIGMNVAWHRLMKGAA